MARPTPTTQLLCAAAACLAALLVAARVVPGQSDFADLVAPVVRAATPGPTTPGAAATAAVPTSDAAARSVVARAAVPAASGAAREFGLDQRERSIPASTGDAFARLDWAPPPPPAPPPRPTVAPVASPPPTPVLPAPPPAPTLPTLPFSFVGMVEQGTGKPQAFLSKGDALLVVSAGDLIENNSYRVDSLSPTALVLTYLPMGKQQTINVSGGSK